MIGYVTIGTNDKDRARVFFDALMGEMGAKRVFDLMHLTAYGTSPLDFFLAVCTPLDRNDANFGNGTMVALKVDTPGDVKRLYAKALELGGMDEGKPGLRPGGFYCAYFRDLDGNKFNFHSLPANKEGDAS